MNKNLAEQAKQDLDNLARAQQMQINTRLTALQSAHTIMGSQNFNGTTDAITLIALAAEIEGYILGSIVQETQEALDKAKQKMNAPQIVRP